MLKDFKVDIDFKRNLNKVIDSKAFFHEKDRSTSVFICNLKMDGVPINLSNCTVSADVMINEGDYKNAPCMDAKIIDASNGVVAFGLLEEFMVVGTKRFQVHINTDNQVLNSPMVEFRIFKGL